MSPTSSFTIRAVGDLLFGAMPPDWSDQGFQHLVGLLKSADLSFGNMETPLVDAGVPISKVDVARTDVRMGDEVQRMGFRLVSLANNHSLDYGMQGLHSTTEALRKHQIAHAGTGSSAPRAFAPTVVQCGERRVALVSALNYFKLGWEHYVEPLKAADRRHGAAVIQGWQVRIAENGRATSVIMPEDSSVTLLTKAIAQARKEADLVVVSLHTHWGPDDTSTITPGRRLIAHEAVNAGADLVLGHGPHTINGIERYKDVFIVHSMGNFFFNVPPGLENLYPDARPFVSNMLTHEPFWHAMMVEAVFPPDGRPSELRVVPIEIVRGTVWQGMPRLASSEASKTIAEDIKKQSEVLGCTCAHNSHHALVVRPLRQPEAMVTGDGSST